MSGKLNIEEGCDGVIWDVIITKTKDSVEKDVSLVFYDFKDPKKNELERFKYNVLMVKDHKAEYVEACIGDVGFYVTNQSRAGWSGIMFREGVLPKKNLKTMFSNVMTKLEVDKSNIKAILTEI